MTGAWTFGRKLGVGMAAVVALTLAMGGVALQALRSVVESKDQVIRQVGENLIDAQRVNAAMHRQVAAVRGYLLLADARFTEDARAASDALAAALRRIRARGGSVDADRALETVSVRLAAYQREVDDVVAARRAETDLAAVAARFDERVIPRFEALAADVLAFVAATERARDDGRVRASEDAERATGLLLAVGALALALAIAVALWLARALSSRIGASVQSINSACAELQAAATQQASGAKEQASAMTEITTTIAELLATSRQIAESGQHVARMAADSAGSAQLGGDAVESAETALTTIRQQVDRIVQHMLELGRRSQQIGGVLAVINELADQTNILAINAMIEAAGAGDSGRRFAVVGEEIRKLADRVGGSAKEIKEQVDEMRAAVNATVMATEAGAKTVEAGARRFQELQAAFSRIGDLIASTTEAAGEIGLSTKQQSTAVEQVNVAIASVAQATRETEASSGQTLETARQLAAMSRELTRLVQRGPS